MILHTHIFTDFFISVETMKLSIY